MLTVAVLFLVVAVIAAVFAFTGVASITAGVAWAVIITFTSLFVVALVIGLSRRPPRI